MQAYMRSLCTEEDGQMKLHFFSCVSALLDATNKHGRLLIKGWGRGLGVPLQIFYDTFIFHQNVTSKHLGYASKKQYSLNIEAPVLTSN